mmetsp:Transcript_66540/g.124132  ORF Transcript_66540/g.124132 Transcript_66540/m.124132 type:complete len:344 (+) Transcript_66540:94-1125(+)
MQGVFPGNFGIPQQAFLFPGQMQDFFQQQQEFFQQQAAAHQQYQPRPQAPPQQKGTPGTSRATLANLARISVKKDDIDANESNECTMCLEELVIGQQAIRLPCDHLFHDCCGLVDWLKKSNECPVCRFELPTDDAEYERERKKRCSGRKLRMRYSDLTRRSAQELRRRAAFLGVDVTGCLEKRELVDRIVQSAQVEIIPDDTEGASPSFSNAPASSSSAPRPLPITRSGLEALKIPEVRGLMEQLGVECPEELTSQSEMVDRLIQSGMLVILPDESGQGSTQRGPQTTAASESSGVAGSSLDLSSQSVSQLRQLARRFCVSLDGCIEKRDIVERIRASPNYRA